ncbi:MAG: hypothetical protein U5K74_06540 [Gemmatimonadaceae bacterium]|nr:hypothetical protein [Gemmatimonadaceae bacterium]
MAIGVGINLRAPSSATSGRVPRRFAGAVSQCGSRTATLRASLCAAATCRSGALTDAELHESRARDAAAGRRGHRSRQRASWSASHATGGLRVVSADGSIARIARASFRDRSMTLTRLIAGARAMMLIVFDVGNSETTDGALRRRRCVGALAAHHRRRGARPTSSACLLPAALLGSRIVSRAGRVTVSRSGRSCRRSPGRWARRVARYLAAPPVTVDARAPLPITVWTSMNR